MRVRTQAGASAARDNSLDFILKTIGSHQRALIWEVVCVLGIHSGSNLKKGSERGKNGMLTIEMIYMRNAEGLNKIVVESMLRSAWN